MSDDYTAHRIEQMLLHCLISNPALLDEVTDLERDDFATGWHWSALQAMRAIGSTDIADVVAKLGEVYQNNLLNLYEENWSFPQNLDAYKRVLRELRETRALAESVKRLDGSKQSNQPNPFSGV